MDCERAVACGMSANGGYSWAKKERLVIWWRSNKTLIVQKPKSDANSLAEWNYVVQIVVLTKCSQMSEKLADRNSWHYLNTFVFPRPHRLVFVRVQLFLLCARAYRVCVYVLMPHSHTTPMRILRRSLKWQKVSLLVEISGSSRLWEGHALAATLLDCHFSLTFGWVSQLSPYCSPLEPPPQK